jgi:hypothetical protein
MKDKKNEIDLGVMKNEFFIRTTGKGEFKSFHLINVDSFNMIDAFFSSKMEASKYAENHGLKVVSYRE